MRAAACTALAATVVSVGAADAAAPEAPPRATGGPPLRFGVYPWGTVGATDPVAGARPEVPGRSLDAVRRLQGGRAFVVRLYGAYSGTDRLAARRLLDDARWWSAHGLRVEMALRYRPTRRALAAGYGPWVRRVARRLAAVDGVVAIQVGNEPNNHDAADAADGAYPGATGAVARAVPIARRAVVAAGRRDIGIGVNWAAGSRPCSSSRFWRALRRAGGTPFVRAVAWVGVDVYPGTWTAPSQTGAPSAEQVGAIVTRTLRCVRTRHLRAAGLGHRVRLTVAETGFPTDPRRTEDDQRAVLQATVEAVLRVRGRYGVTDLRWFALRDGNTASGQLENGYGLLRDDHTPKPAFWAYRDLVAATGR